ncbi:hypothetical protein JT358_06000 [Micrococcales bacterium 31B]|nr:hypothetical protein [Micrococcales bacterium 31B]
MAFAPSGMIAIPISLLMLWIALSFTVMTVFNRGAKRGFGKRWVITIILWGVAWMVSVIGALNWFADQTWFLVAACAALTAITVAGAWVEATR